MRGGAEGAWRVAAGSALVIGVAATTTPGLLARVVGLPAADMTGSARMLSRWFGIRTAAIAGAALAGNRPARLAIPLIQVPDQVVMVHAWAGGSVPARPVLTALAISWGLVVASALALRSEHTGSKGGDALGSSRETVDRE